jgi:hypothetical protein
VLVQERPFISSEMSCLQHRGPQDRFLTAETAHWFWGYNKWMADGFDFDFAYAVVRYISNMKASRYRFGWL